VSGVPLTLACPVVSSGSSKTSGSNGAAGGPCGRTVAGGSGCCEVG
jgi:hypothetical protein